jgi:hypothetical protein
MSKKNISKVLLMKPQHTLFMHKWRIWMLLQTIHVLLMKGWTEAALIELSIFFLSTVFAFGVFFLPNLCHSYTYTLMTILLHLYPYEHTLTPIPLHIYPRTYTLTPIPLYLYPYTYAHSQDSYRQCIIIRYKYDKWWEIMHCFSLPNIFY